MSMNTTIVIIEDERNICSFIEKSLTPHGFRVFCSYNGREGLARIRTIRPDIILLDLGLPDIDGIDLIRQIREQTNIPVIVISARTAEKSKVTALDLGADDYLTKPFGVAELQARIRTALRHHDNTTRAQRSRYEVDGLLIDFDRRLVRLNGTDIHLTQIEYKLVSLLAQNAGRVMTYETIIAKIWGPYAENDNQILRVNMAHIRRKLEERPAEPRYIFTEIGVGYRMREE